jgi:hypothetical protein
MLFTCSSWIEIVSLGGLVVQGGWIATLVHIRQLKVLDYITVLKLEISFA